MIVKMSIESEIIYDKDKVKITAFQEFDDKRMEMYSKLISLEDEAVRNALIALGWTPPEEN